MNLNGFVKTASDEDIIKVAETIRKNISEHFDSKILPAVEKLAEEKVPTEEEQAAAAAAVGEVTPTPVNDNKSANFQGKTNDVIAGEKPTVDKDELVAALTEVIMNVDVKGLAKIIVTLRDTIGDDVAENAISVARQIMQDALVSGSLQKEQIAGLAQAFEALGQE